MKNNTTVVLVHGAWADGSSWAKVIEPLAAQGFEVLAAPLPLSSFEADVVSVEHTLERTTGPVILVGHAYAGAVMGAVQNERVKSLVYVTALAPEVGETVAEVFYREPAHPRAPKLAPDAHGLIYLPNDAFASAFAPNASIAEQAVLAAVQRPISPACISVPMSRPRWHQLPSHFLVAKEDVMILEATQRFMANRMGAKVRAHAVDHSPMVTAPAAVVEIVREAAGEVRA